MVAVAVLLIPAAMSESLTALPPVSPDSDDLSSQQRVIVTEFTFTGNTIFSDSELQTLVADYRHREMTLLELLDITDVLTRHYIDKGYINSGALLPKQKVTDGVVRYQIIEGSLSEIEITGKRRLTDHFVISRMLKSVKATPNIFDIQEALQVLEQNPLIKRINSELKPGMTRGDAVLKMTVEEARLVQLGFSFNNHRSPSIGSYRGEVYGAIRDVTGWGDVLSGSYGLTEGLDDFSAAFSVPVTRHDTTVTMAYGNNDSTVVTDDFEVLDIKSTTDTVSIGIRQPVYRTRSRELSLSIRLELKESHTELLDTPFSFSSGVENGESKVTLLSLGQEWVDRKQNRVVALRSTFGVGLDVFDATMLSGQADGEFVTWLGQFQLVRRLSFLESEFQFSTDLRLANDELLPLEKFAMGGHDTVRGYRENELTRDGGLVINLEYRVPIWSVRLPIISTRPDDGQVRLVVFGDYARGWNEGSGTSGPDDIAGIGLGCQWFPGQSVSAEIYWGAALRSIDRNDDRDLQDDGVHFQIRAGIF